MARTLLRLGPRHNDVGRSRDHALPSFAPSPPRLHFPSSPRSHAPIFSHSAANYKSPRLSTRKASTFGPFGVSVFACSIAGRPPNLPRQLNVVFGCILRFCGRWKWGLRTQTLLPTPNILTNSISMVLYVYTSSTRPSLRRPSRREDRWNTHTQLFDKT